MHEGCATLYAECRRLAPDFHLKVEVWGRGRQVCWRGSVGECLYVGTRALAGDPKGDLLALCDTLLRAQVILAEARGITLA